MYRRSAPDAAPTRRGFLQAASGAAAFSSAIPALRAQQPQNRVDVLVNERIARIAPELYGHFVEHLGAVVYDGIWVGEQSRIPNERGVRKQLLDALRAVKPSVIRWPGGCFADQYDWRDGTGDPARRPVRTNFWVDSREWAENANRKGPQVYDPNTFGTVEFVRFCRAVGAEPYLAANLRSLPAQEFWRWVEYCNSPQDSTTLAKQRAADGEPEPLNVRYWGVGNESWGCGGNFTAEEYAAEYRRFTAWVPSYGVELALIGAGPNSDNRQWTRRFFERAGGAGLGRTWGWAAHHYSWNASGGRTRDWFEGKGSAVDFAAEAYYEILAEAAKMDRLIESQWGVMAEADPQHRVKLVVDEWGSWYQPGTEPFPEALLGQQNTMRDAVLAGMTFDIFHRHADKVAMANIAQLVNCLQSLFFAHEDRFAVTPTYHLFAMYADHQGGQSLRTEVAAPALGYTRNEKPASIQRFSSSASRQGQTVIITINHLHMSEAAEVSVVLHGATADRIEAQVLAGDRPQAHNRFDAPNEVLPRPTVAVVREGAIRCTLPPASVTKLKVQMI